jgi:hypothetical protein
MKNVVLSMLAAVASLTMANYVGAQAPALGVYDYAKTFTTVRNMSYEQISALPTGKLAPQSFDH